MAQAKTATIKIEKDNPSHRGVVRGAVNGQRFELEVGKEVQVTRAQMAALKDSRVEFTTVTPFAGEDADEGSSASSTVTGTAIRAEPPERVNEGLAQGDHELSQRTDEELKAESQEAGAAAGEASATETTSTAETKPKSAAKPKAAATKPKTSAPAKKAAANK